jgi:tetratricopeptide (TPR) repeat protein
MVRVKSVAAIVIALSLAGGPLAALAQTTGMVKGKVVDAKNQPVIDAKIVIEFKDAAGRQLETKTNKKGEYIQVGLQPGKYAVTASKEGVGTQTFDISVSIGQSADVNFTLSPTSGGDRPITAEEKAKLDKTNALFSEGVAAIKAQNFPEAVAKFGETTKLMPECAACFINLGIAHRAAGQLDQAEAAVKKAAALEPDKPDAYNELARIYTEQKKYNEAAEATAMAAKFGGGATGAGGGQSADQLFNQGVNYWNAGKYAEAKAAWEQAVKLKPDYSEAHYQLGLAALNTGDTATAKTAFETYLKLEPTGKHAEQVKAMLPQLK